MKGFGILLMTILIISSFGVFAYTDYPVDFCYDTEAVYDDQGNFESRADSMESGIVYDDSPDGGGKELYRDECREVSGKSYLHEWSCVKKEDGSFVARLDVRECSTQKCFEGKLGGACPTVRKYPEPEDRAKTASIRSEFEGELASTFAKAGPYCPKDVAKFVLDSLFQEADSRGFLKQPDTLAMEREKPELKKCLDTLEGKVEGRSTMSRQEFRKKISDFVNTYNDKLAGEDYGAYAKTDSEYSSKSFTGGFAGVFGNSGFFVMLVVALFIGLFVGRESKKEGRKL